MPTISLKGSKMPSSPIRKLVPFAEAAKKRGTHVIHLNIGQPDIKTPKVALDAVKNAKIKTLAYSRTEGSEEYRSKIAAYYAKHDLTVDASDIIVTTGGSEALSFTMGSILDKGDEVIIPEPFYANYNGFATANGVNIVPIISKLNFYLAPSISSPLILITIVGVSALEVTVMAFLKGPAGLLVSYLTSICPVSPGAIGSSGFLGIVQPQLDFTLLITSGASPVFVNSKVLTPSPPRSTLP